MKSLIFIIIHLLFSILFLLYLILDASWGVSLVVSLAIAFDLVCLWAYHKEKEDQTKSKSDKESDKKEEEDGEDILSHASN